MKLSLNGVRISSLPRRKPGPIVRQLRILMQCSDLPTMRKSCGGKVGPGLRRGSGEPTRRRVLVAVAGVGLTWFAPKAGATTTGMDEAIRELIGEVTLERGKVKLELPSIREN